MNVSITFFCLKNTIVAYKVGVFKKDLQILYIYSPLHINQFYSNEFGFES